MGSFNLTCGASGQTIDEGDKCRVVPLVQSSTYSPVKLTFGDHELKLHGIANATCYANAFWTPVVGFLPAVYADCGQMDLRLDTVSRSKLLTFFLGLYRHAPVVSSEEGGDIFDLNAYLESNAPRIQALLNVESLRFSVVSDDAGLDDECATVWRYAWDVAYRSQLFTVDNRKVRPVAFAVIHEEAFQLLVARTKAQQTWERESMAPEAFLRRAMVAARESAATYEGDQNMVELAFSDALLSGIRHLDARNQEWPRLVESAILRPLAKKVFAGAMSDEQFIEVASPMLDDRYAVCALSDLNLRFSPMVTVGQDNRNSVGQSFASFVSEASKKVTRARMEQMYGRFTQYTVLVAERSDFEAAMAKVRQWDGAFDEVTETRCGSQLKVTFSCTLKLDDLMEYLSEQHIAAVDVASLQLAD